MANGKYNDEWRKIKQPYHLAHITSATTTTIDPKYPSYPYPKFRYFLFIAESGTTVISARNSYLLLENNIFSNSSNVKNKIWFSDPMNSYKITVEFYYDSNEQLVLKTTSRTSYNLDLYGIL